MGKKYKSIKSKKKRILAWGDAPNVSTGFGKVMKHILWALHRTGKYDIDVIGINHWGDPYDTNEYPYKIFPAGIPPAGDMMSEDIFGIKRFGFHAYSGVYDYIFVLNDLYVMSSAKNLISKINSQLRKKFKVVYYFPVDGPVPEEWVGLADIADIPVTYTEFGRAEVVKASPSLADKIRVIYHGTDTDDFYHINPEKAKDWKIRSFGEEEPFVIGSVARNSSRKDLTTLIVAFSEFRKKVKNSKLYLHCQVQDMNIDLKPVLRHLGLKIDVDVLFPKGFRADMGFPVEAVNRLYNIIDVFALSTLGEGWGLPVTEAMAARTPVVVPNNTSMPEIIGSGDDVRGIMVKCGQNPDYMVRVDNSGLRPKTSALDLADKLFEVYTMIQERDPKLFKMLDNAQRFVKKHTWETVGREWISIFRELEKE